MNSAKKRDSVLPVYDAASMGNQIPTLGGYVVFISRRVGRLSADSTKNGGLEWLNEYYLSNRNCPMGGIYVVH